MKTGKSSHLGMKLISYLIIMLVMGLSSLYLYQLPIKNIEVYAAFNYLKPEIFNDELIKLAQSERFFTLNTKALKKRFLAIEPWIYAINILRTSPGTLKIYLVEQRPYLRWQNALLNHEGQLFKPAHTFPAHLPKLFGPESELATMFNFYERASTILESVDLTITELTLTTTGWKINCGSLTIFTRTTGAIEALNRMTNFYRKLLTKHANPPKYIDLRYTSGLALKW